MHECPAAISTQEAVCPEFRPCLRVIHGAARKLRLHAHDVAVPPIRRPWPPIRPVLDPNLIRLLEILLRPPVWGALYITETSGENTEFGLLVWHTWAGTAL